MTSREQVTDKPDFGEIAQDILIARGYAFNGDTPETVMGIAMEKIWTTHVEPLKEENDKLREALKEREWISVEEGLPEDSGTYLVKTTTGKTEISEYHTSDFMMDDNCVRQFYMQDSDIEQYVTHWQKISPPIGRDKQK